MVNRRVRGLILQYKKRQVPISANFCKSLFDVHRQYFGITSSLESLLVVPLNCIIIICEQKLTFYLNFSWK